MNKSFRLLLIMAGSLMLASVGYAYNCANVAQYVDGNAYSTGAVVQNSGHAYQCTIGGWCTVGGPYAPGTGWAWTSAWSDLGACNGGGNPPPSSGNPPPSSGNPPPSSSNPPPSSGNPPPSSGNGCDNVAAWNASAAYSGGNEVSYNGNLYTANWWTQGDNPATHSGQWQVWTLVGACSGGGNPPPSSGNPPPSSGNPPPSSSNPPPSSGNPPPSGATTGTIDYHLLLGVGQAQDTMTLDGGNYNDLIMSNLIAGVMLGHLIQEYYPGIQYNRQYLYGTMFGQLMQENIETSLYQSSSDLIDSSPLQQSVMSTGQGGPYQINNYTADMVNGSYAAEGYALVNFVALQKNIGFTVAENKTQVTQPTPAAFNNKYYSPMLTAYFHYLDFVAMNKIGKGANGWQTPWEPAYDQMLETFKSLPNNFLDVVLNVAYNQGFYGGLVAHYSSLGATATQATVAQVDDYNSVWGNTSTYSQYPHQVHYYLDQLYGNPIPTGTDGQTTRTPDTHVVFHMSKLRTVFGKVFHTLAYVDSAGNYGYIPESSATAAFDTALGQTSIQADATLDLSNATARAKIFDLLEDAITNLETSLGTQFNARTTSQL